MVVEVSQKQAYIFESNKLADNIKNSNNICCAISSEYFEKKCSGTDLYSKERNMVYSGGGHTVLCFESKEKAVDFAKFISKDVRKDYSGIEFFIKIKEYDKNKTPSDNHIELIKELEVKKSKRESSFRKISFGIEEVDNQSFNPKLVSKNKDYILKIPEKENEYQNEKMRAEINGYEKVFELEKLGGSKDKSNFIAVVHIDGNAMGKRIADLKNIILEMDKSFEKYRKVMDKFSLEIDCNFKNAFNSMVYKVILNMEKNNLVELDISGKKLPIRRIITAGDDICFVCDGRIGLECASIFLKEISKIVNNVDKKPYSACAGVCIVHSKFPFYRAYEISESLCSNAKVFINKFGENKRISAIDWHIEFGEMKESLSEIKSQYITSDGNRMDLRPFIVAGDENIIEKEKIRRYDKFRELVIAFKKDKEFSRGKIKELRNVLQQGERNTEYYIRSNRMDNILFSPLNEAFEHTSIADVVEKGLKFKKNIFLNFETDNSNGENFKRCIIFDAIEIIDTFIPLEYDLS